MSSIIGASVRLLLWGFAVTTPGIKIDAYLAKQSSANLSRPTVGCLSRNNSSKLECKPSAQRGPLAPLSALLVPRRMSGAQPGPGPAIRPH